MDRFAQEAALSARRLSFLASLSLCVRGQVPVGDVEQLGELMLVVRGGERLFTLEAN